MKIWNIKKKINIKIQFKFLAEAHAQARAQKSVNKIVLSNEKMV